MSGNYKSFIYERIFRLFFSIRKKIENTRISEWLRIAFFKWLEKRYGDTLYYEAEIHEKKILFSTEDYYSKGWFFPRYKDGKIHEEAVTLFLIGELKSSRCFVDVGTNLGWYSILASVFMKAGTVYGFEMDEMNFALAKKNSELNRSENLYLFHAAVSDTCGQISYIRNSLNPNAEFRIASDLKKTKDENIISIESIALDDFFKDKEIQPDIVKIDVEGAEIKVLRGMTRILENSSPKLFVEIHPFTMVDYHSSAEQVIALLISHGYKVFEIENMRGHGVDISLKELNSTSHFYYNAMLYAYNPGLAKT